MLPVGIGTSKGAGAARIQACSVEAAAFEDVLLQLREQQLRCPQPVGGGAVLAAGGAAAAAAAILATLRCTVFRAAATRGRTGA